MVDNTVYVLLSSGVSQQQRRIQKGEITRLANFPVAVANAANGISR